MTERIGKPKRSRKVAHCVIVTVLAILAMVSFVAGVVSFVRPVYDWETEIQIGKPEDPQTLWFAMNDGVFHFKHSVAVEGPPYRPVWGKEFAGLSISSVDFPGNPASSRGCRLRMLNVPFWQPFVRQSQTLGRRTTDAGRPSGRDGRNRSRREGWPLATVARVCRWQPRRRDPRSDRQTVDQRNHRAGETGKPT